MAKKKEYALYDGDEYIMSGSLDEIANHLGIKRKSVFFYSSPTHKRRDPNGIAVVAVPDDDEDNDPCKKCNYCKKEEEKHGV